MFGLGKSKQSVDHREGAPEKKRARNAWLRPAAVLAMVFLFVLVGLSAGFQDASAVGPPIVDGLFYALGDDAIYYPFGYSDNGSVLYVYFDNPTLYAALVVDRGINDNVCAAQAGSGSPDYTQDAGFPNHRSCKRATDSEYASFNLRCTTSPNEWTWQQGYAGEVGGVWISGTTVGGGLGTPPPVYAAGSSFAWNINNYRSTWGPGNPAPWDLYDGAGDASPVDDWHSPFDSNDPTYVVGLDGYPTINTSTYSTVYQWEWPMVYEWSADLSVCGANPAFLIAGQSHHSPPKEGAPPDDEYDPFFDRGDLPDSYSTLLASGGPSHEFVLTDAVFLGPTRDNDADGNPTVDATGDDVDKADDEDGVTLANQQWLNGATVDINVAIQGNAPSADVGMWIDWDVNGTFECSEFYSFLDLTVGANNVVQVTIPGAGTYNVGDPVHMRVRVFDDETNAPGGSLECTDFGGAVENGEVEDYVWPFSPTAITLTDVSANPMSGYYPLLWLGLIILAAITAIALLRRGRQEAV